MFTGKEEEINFLGDGTEKPEFGKWAWISANQVVDHQRYEVPPNFRRLLSSKMRRLCRVLNVRLQAEPETDEVYAQITLLPETDQSKVPQCDDRCQTRYLLLFTTMHQLDQ
ncbi:PREDICTED: uncharacterized protein LOC109152164 isoform X2 [Ipomoea nil]|uniref:uncharacterized protein LOC109152164 isoform X2 n=1 Tax=Ipomoea nil TaxID=35883 RepID=UPI000900EA9E|nr:PREDICTED: uncharacterized protein LOC109152164 isoform X2 [Ipomoea nil]